MCSKASPVNLVGDIIQCKYVFSCLKADTFLSCSHVVTGKVENILRHCDVRIDCMVDLLQSC